MILNDYEHVIMESDLEMLDYVIESAKFEIDNGNDSYMAVYEAASSSADKANDNWISKVINKIKIFCKSLIAKAKMILKQIVNKIRLLKAKKIKKKVDNASQKLYLNLARYRITSVKLRIFKSATVPVLPLILKKLDESKLNDVLQSSASKFSELIKNNNIISKDDKFRNYLNIKESTSFVSDNIYIDDIKKYMDSAVYKLNLLSGSVNKLNDESKKLKNAGISPSTVRYGMSTMYSLLSNVVSDYYKCASVLAEFFMKNSVEGDPKKSDDPTAYAHFTTAEEIIKKMREKMDKEMSDIFDKIEKEKLAQEAEKARAAMQKMYTQWSEARKNINNNQIPESTEAYNESDVKKIYEQITRYIDRVNDIFEKKLENAKNEEEVELVSKRHLDALEMINDVIEKEASGKLPQNIINDLKSKSKDIEFSNYDKLDQKFVHAERNSRTGSWINKFSVKFKDYLDVDWVRDSYTKGKWSTGDGIEAITLNHIEEYVNSEKYVDINLRAVLRKAAIKSCNKIIASIYKKYGRSPDVSKMEKIDRRNYMRASRYVKELRKSA